MRADNSRFHFLVASFSILVLLSACDRMVTSRNTRLVKEADWKAARLRNENLNLHREIDAGSTKPRPAADKSASRRGDKEKTASKKAGSHTYTVKEGDTLASISRKFYKTSKRWRDIREANEKEI